MFSDSCVDVCTKQTLDPICRSNTPRWSAEKIRLYLPSRCPPRLVLLGRRGAMCCSTAQF